MTLLQNPTLAQTQAQQNASANLSAISQLQPDLTPWIQEQHLPVEWVFGRDRSLTALDESGQWFSGCSLPTRAAEAMFARLEARGAVVCMLLPSHAAHLRVALRRLRSEQAIIAVIPDMRHLAMILHCDDFTDEIQSHRLWFAAGPAWEIGLRRLFDDQPGLATPLQFIRSPDVDRDSSDEMITAAQKIFADVTASRSEQIQSLRLDATRQAPQATRRLCVVAGSRFRLWNDIGASMLGVFENQSQIPIEHFDADDPARSAPLALLQACQNCNAIFTANTVRSDLPGLIPDQLPWITWATTARIPSSALAGEWDQLIVVDPKLKDLAIKAGWNASRVHVGSFPSLDQSSKSHTGEGRLGIFVDTCTLETPEDLANYSSHSLLWEGIRHELHRDPFALLDVLPFLTERMKRMGIGEDGFPFNRFIEKLIMPAYQQGLARTLIGAGVPLQLYGAGWDKLPEFAAHAAGEIVDRDQFHSAIAQCAALVHVWPSALAHPIDASGALVVRRTTRRPEPFVQEARAAAAGKPGARKSGATAPISLDLLRNVLSSAGISARS